MYITDDMPTQFLYTQVSSTRPSVNPCLFTHITRVTGNMSFRNTVLPTVFYCTYLAYVPNSFRHALWNSARIGVPLELNTKCNLSYISSQNSKVSRMLSENTRLLVEVIHDGRRLPFRIRVQL